MRYAGKDATAAYEPIHPTDALEKNLPPSKCLGDLDTSAALTVTQERENKQPTKDQLRMEKAQRNKPPLGRVLSLADMEVGLHCNIACYCSFDM